MKRVRAMVLHPGDDVAVLLEIGQPGDRVEGPGGTVVLREAVPRFHKVALRRLEAGQEVHKIGETIGVAQRLIQSGEHVHVHNLRSTRSGGSYRRES